MWTESWGDELRQFFYFIDKDNQCLKEKGITWMVQRLSEKYFWKCIYSTYYTLSFGGRDDELWGKDNAPQNISGHKRKRNCRNICWKIDLFEVCLS